MPIEPEIADATRAALQPIISRPKLSDKLLSKAPFRFLHDIVSNVTKATSFAEGLFEGDELVGTAIKGKEPKCNYLNKIITCVGICLGEPVDVRVGKIVAGLEPENTNIFLQALGRVASDDMVDSEQAVSRTLNGEAPGDGPPARRGAGGQKNADVGGKGQDQGDNEDNSAELERERQREQEEREERERRKQRKEEEARARRREEEERRAREEEASRQQADEGKNGDGNSNSGGGGSGRELNVTENWEDTKAIIETIIQKPRMQEKLLNKPPFRYLHDIVMAIRKETGFLEGLFDENEMVGKAIKDKNVKMGFLQKVITCVGHFYGQEMEAQPRKIVAGMDANLTNKLLQALANGALSGDSSDEAVQRTRNGEEIRAPSNKSGGSGNRRAETKPKQQQGDQGSFEVATKREKRQPREESKRSDATSNAEQKQSSGGDSGQKKSDVGQRKKLSRPSTARRRPPKVTENLVEQQMRQQEVVQQATAGIIRDGEDSESDDEDMNVRANNSDIATKLDDGEAHNKLLVGIMNEEKEKLKKNKKAEEEKNNSKAPVKAEESKGIRMGRLGRKKKRKDKNRPKSGGQKNGDYSQGSSKSSGGAMSSDQLEELRGAIQTLCQSINPLAKCMDYVPDDIAQMSKESEEWRSLIRDKEDNDGEEKEEKDETLRDLEDRKNELEDKIESQQVKINGIKATIARNDQRIQELLRMVVATSP
jgi:TRAF3-interacting protein 1